MSSAEKIEQLENRVKELEETVQVVVALASELTHALKGLSNEVKELPGANTMSFVWFDIDRLADRVPRAR